MIETISCGDFEMKCLRFGKKGARPLVVLPGLSLISVMTFAEPVMNAYKIYAEDHEVFLFDRREQIPDRYTVYDMARDTSEAMDRLGIKDADLMGISQGGMIGLVIALERPELVRALALCSSAVGVGEDAERIISRWKGMAESGDIKTLYKCFGSDLYTENFCKQNEDAFELLADMVSENDRQRFIILADATSGFDVTGRAAEISCPVCVFAASGDVIFPMALQAGFAKRYGWESQVFEGYGHAVYDECPQFHPRVEEFFNNN